MNKLMGWLEDDFAPAANQLFQRPWIAGFSSAMQKVIPFILTGSVIFVYDVLAAYLTFLPDLSPILNYSFGLLTLLITFMLTNQLMVNLDHPDYETNASLLSIGVLLMAVMPTGEEAGSVDALMEAIGPSGMMVGIIVGFFVALVFHLWAKVNFLSESSIPDFVVTWINTIIPNLIALAIAMIVVIVFGINIQALTLAIFEPIANISQTLPGFLLLTTIPAFFYTLGISSWTFGAITTPIFIDGIQRNIDAVAAGEAATNIVTSESVFTLAFITLGGMGATLGLNILMAFSKSKDVKTLGRIFIGPSIFNINEPLMFGAPVVFNPVLMVPTWINTIINTIYVWVLMSTGLLNIPDSLIQVGQVPAPISSVLVTQDMRAVLWWAIILVINTLVWYPFFKVYENDVIETGHMTEE